ERGGAGGAYTLDRMTLNAAEHSGPLRIEELEELNRLDVWLRDDPQASGAALHAVSDSDWRAVFGPRPPVITSVSERERAVDLAIDLAGEDPEALSMHIYRDGIRVASDLPASTTWTDLDVASLDTSSYCYSVELSFASGNHSQHAAPQCWW